MPSLSFIVPYYRLEISLLERCLRSLLAVRTEGVVCEVIVVDDGTPSEFGVSECIASFGEPCIRYLYQPNQGLGAARNAGLNAARMEYVWFVDADDYLFVEQGRLLWQLWATEQPDILTFSFRKVYASGVEVFPVKKEQPYFRGSGTDFLLRHNLCASACAYIFRRALADDVRFLPGIAREDEEFTPRLFLQAERLVATRQPVYAYYQRPGSILHARTEQLVQKNLDDALFVAVRLRELANVQPEPKARALRRRVAQLASDILINALCWSDNRRFLDKQLRNLREQRLFHLKHIRPDVKHRLFSLLTAREWQVVCLWRLYRLCRWLRKGCL